VEEAFDAVDVAVDWDSVLRGLLESQTGTTEGKEIARDLLGAGVVVVRDDWIRDGSRSGSEVTRGDGVNDGWDLIDHIVYVTSDLLDFVPSV